MQDQQSRCHEQHQPIERKYEGDTDHDRRAAGIKGVARPFIDPIRCKGGRRTQRADIGAEARQRSSSRGRQRNAGQDQEAADGDPPTLTHICKCAERPQPLQHAGKHQGCGKNDWGENDDVWMVLQSF